MIKMIIHVPEKAQVQVNIVVQVLVKLNGKMFMYLNGNDHGEVLYQGGGRSNGPK